MDGLAGFGSWRNRRVYCLRLPASAVSPEWLQAIL